MLLRILRQPANILTFTLLAQSFFMPTSNKQSNQPAHDLFTDVSSDALSSFDLSAAEKMTPTEVRATYSLAAIYGLRMFGMFSILPIFAIYASTLAEKPSSLMIGLALGAYGLTQALFQLPFGMASDRFGRKR
jgi:hypothetical protein